MLTGKKVLVGVTGGIAAYKIPEFIRLLKKNNSEVKCILTEAAARFVSSTSLSVLSGSPVHCSLFAERASIDHIELSRWADVFVILPATANTLAKMANGIADNLLTTTALSFQGPVLVAPAMNEAMWRHPATTDNLKKITGYGVQVIGPDKGALACGEAGTGRMTSLERIFQHVVRATTPATLKGKKVLVTGGPTREHLDPVRYISNASSGKMGYALALAAWHHHASVTYICGPTSIDLIPEVNPVPVTSTKEMLNAVKSHFLKSDLFISNAAVADIKPKNYSKTKTQKAKLANSILVEKTGDILAWAGLKKKKKQITVGFALETANDISNGTKKLKSKHCDFLCINNPQKNKGTIGGDTNSVTLIEAKGSRQSFENMPKSRLAHMLISTITSK